MNKFKSFIGAFVLTISLFQVQSAHAVLGVGDVVFDPTAQVHALEGIMNDMESLANEVTMIQNQVTQYENMVKNTMAPVTYVWDKATMAMNKIRSLNGTVDRYVNKFGNIEGYLGKFKDLNYWKSSPCYSNGGCTDEELQEVHDAIAFGSESQNESNSDFIRVMNNQQDALESDAETLQRLQDQATDADGQMKALQAANQLASAQASQILQLRSGFNAFAAAVIQRQQALQAIEAQAQAAGIALRRDTTKIVPSDNEGWGFR